jgi:hypothetical protein
VSAGKTRHRSSAKSFSKSTPGFVIAWKIVATDAKTSVIDERISGIAARMSTTDAMTVGRAIAGKMCAIDERIIATDMRIDRIDAKICGIATTVRDVAPERIPESVVCAIME